jgi:hypothetical protein
MSGRAVTIYQSQTTLSRGEPGPGRAGRRRTTRSSAAYAKGRGLAHWRCHRGLVFLGRSLDPSVGSLYTAAASGRGCGASASADVAGLVDVLPSADAVGRAADTHTVTDTVGRVAFFDSRFQGWCVVRPPQNRRFRWRCSPISSVFEGAAVERVVEGGEGVEEGGKGGVEGSTGREKDASA